MNAFHHFRQKHTNKYNQAMTEEMLAADDVRPKYNGTQYNRETKQWLAITDAITQWKK